MKKLKFLLMKISISDEVKSLKVLISGLIAILLSSFIPCISATTSVITICLIFAFLPTISTTRAYCTQLIIVNILGACITFVIGYLMNWSVYSLAIISSFIMFIYYKLNLSKKNYSIISFLVGSVVFFMIMSTPGNAGLSRIISIIIGSIIAILINELIFPINQGFKFEKILYEISNDIFKTEDILLTNIEFISEDNLMNLDTSIISIKPNLELLQKELVVNTLRNHLKYYTDKIDILKSFDETTKSAYELLKVTFNLEYGFRCLSSSDKIYVTDIIKNLSDNHKILLNNYKDRTTPPNINIITISNLKLDLTNDIAVKILGKLIKYRSSLLNLKEVMY